MDPSGKPSKPANKFWTPARITLTLTVSGLLAAMSIASCNSANSGPGANANSPKAIMTVNSSPSAAKSSPPSTEAVVLPVNALDAPLKTIDGKAFKLSELKGKVLVIDLWATWCGPCRYEVPELVKMQNEYGPRGFEIVGLDIDQSESPEDVRDFMKEFSVNYKVAFSERELSRSLMRGGNIPQSLVIGRDGNIVLHLIGFDPVSTPKRMRAAIEQALQ